MAKALAWPRVGQAARWAVGASGAGIEEKRRNERMRERGSAVVIDGQLCLPPEPFIKIQRG